MNKEVQKTIFLMAYRHLKNMGVEDASKKAFHFSKNGSDLLNCLLTSSK